MSVQAGRVVLLDGPPRAGKSTVAAAVQREVAGTWVNLGVDAARSTTPAHLQPGVGLRPGGERADLEPVVATLYRALFASVAAHARLGLDVVVDVGLHRSYATGLDPRAIAADELTRLPVLLVAVRCPLAEVRRRRLCTWGDDGASSGPGGTDAAAAWDEAIRAAGPHDLEVDTVELTPSGCASAIADALQPPPWSVLWGGLSPR